MNAKMEKELKEKLEKQKEELTTELEKFASKDKNLDGDWDTKFPNMNTGVGSQQIEEAADEVEAYSTLLPIEHNLELRLQDTNLALEKLEAGNYGICEKCAKKIDEDRLKVYPEARTCSDCQ